MSCFIYDKNVFMGRVLVGFFCDFVVFNFEGKLVFLNVF